MTVLPATKNLSHHGDVADRACAVDSPIRFEQVVSRDDFAALKDEWDTLLLQSQTPSPFLSWDYPDVWWDVYGDKGFEVKLFIARDAWNKLADAEIRVKTAASLPSPILPINSSWNDYLKSRSKNRRSKVRRDISKAKMERGMKQLLVDRDISLTDGYEELVRLSKARWDGCEGKAFHTPAFIDFHRKLASRLLEKDSLFFGIIELVGQRAGAIYDIIFDNKMWGYQAPWDPAFSSVGVGNLLNLWRSKTAFDLGLREIDWLPGDSSAKDTWATCARTLNIYEATYPKRIGGNFFSLARGVERIFKHNKQS